VIKEEVQKENKNRKNDVLQRMYCLGLCDTRLFSTRIFAGRHKGTLGQHIHCFNVIEEKCYNRE